MCKYLINTRPFWCFCIFVCRNLNLIICSGVEAIKIWFWMWCSLLLASILLRCYLTPNPTTFALCQTITKSSESVYSLKSDKLLLEKKRKCRTSFVSPKIKWIIDWIATLQWTPLTFTRSKTLRLIHKSKLAINSYSYKYDLYYI